MDTEVELKIQIPLATVGISKNGRVVQVEFFQKKTGRNTGCQSTIVEFVEDDRLTLSILSDEDIVGRIRTSEGAVSKYFPPITGTVCQILELLPKNLKSILEELLTLRGLYPSCPDSENWVRIRRAFDEKPVNLIPKEQRP